MTPEGKVKKDIKDVLAAHGIYPTAKAATQGFGNCAGWYFMPVPTGYGESGIPDFICCIHGTFVGIEAKKKKGKQARRQPLVEKAIVSAGGRYYTVRSGEEMESILDKLGVYAWT